MYFSLKRNCLEECAVYIILLAVNVKKKVLSIDDKSPRLARDGPLERNRGRESERLALHPRTNRTEAYNTRIATSVASAAAREPARLPGALSGEPPYPLAARILVMS